MTDEALPGLERLTDKQLRGLACVRCRRRLPPSWRAARRLGVVTDQAGREYGLYACAPPARPSPAASRTRPGHPVAGRTA